MAICQLLIGCRVLNKIASCHKQVHAIQNPAVATRFVQSAKIAACDGSRSAVHFNFGRKPGEIIF